MSGATVIIPARLHSTRLPGKVLLAETGSPMIVHVCEAAARGRAVDRVVVATDHPDIAATVEQAGFQSVMTSARHANGTSRIAEAAEKLGLDDRDVVINVQGDEPEIKPGVIDGAVHALVQGDVDIGTVVSPFGDGEDADDPNAVKAVLGQPKESDGPRRAVYFSRAAVPYDRGGERPVRYRHVGIYAYRAGFVRWYACQDATPLERAEKLEQLRALELGRTIGVVEVSGSAVGIDTPEDYRAFVKRWLADGARS